MADNSWEGGNMPPWFTGDVVNGIGTTVGFFLAAIVGRAIREMKK